MHSFSQRRPSLSREPTPAGIQTPASRTQIGTALIVLFALLLVAFTAYGMWNSNEGLLDKVFELVRYGLFAALGWAFGRHTPRWVPNQG